MKRKTHREMFLFAASFSWWFWGPDAGFAAGLSRAWQGLGKPAEAGLRNNIFLPQPPTKVGGKQYTYGKMMSAS
ncbi:MAG: hypothetical protein V3U29_05380 [Phycisphaeraceae bacterium]